MPMYEYECQSCKAQFEALKTIAEKDHTAACPKCKGISKRKLSAFAVGKESAGPQVPAHPGGCGGCPSAQMGQCPKM